MRRKVSKLLAMAFCGVFSILPIGSAKGVQSSGIDRKNPSDLTHLVNSFDMRDLIFFDFNEIAIAIKFDTDNIQDGVDDLVLAYPIINRTKTIFYLDNLKRIGVDIDRDENYRNDEIIHVEKTLSNLGVWGGLKAVEIIYGSKIALRIDRDRDGREDLTFYYQIMGGGINGIKVQLVGVSDDLDGNGKYSLDEITFYPIHGQSGYQ